MDGRVFKEWAADTCCNHLLPGGKGQVIFVDNASGHVWDDATQAIFKSKNIELKFLPANATHLCQPADSFIIKNIKEVWLKEWDSKKLQLLREHSFSNLPNKKGEWSGKLVNPGKEFFLRLAAHCVETVNGLHDSNGVSYARKSMIRCGLAKNLNGVWELQQLFPHLQDIIKRFPENFEGTNPDEVVADGGESEEETKASEKTALDAVFESEDKTIAVV